MNTTKTFEACSICGGDHPHNVHYDHRAALITAEQVHGEERRIMIAQARLLAIREIYRSRNTRQ